MNSISYILPEMAIYTGQNKNCFWEEEIFPQIDTTV